MGGPGGEWRGRGSSRQLGLVEGRELSRGGVAARVDSAPGGEGRGPAAAGLQWGLMARSPAEAQRRWSLHGRQPGSHLPGVFADAGDGGLCAVGMCARAHCREGCWGGQAGPCSSRSHRPPAAPRSCIIDKDELKDGLRVLIPMDVSSRCCHAGHVQTLHSPDM